MEKNYFLLFSHHDCVLLVAKSLPRTCTRVQQSAPTAQPKSPRPATASHHHPFFQHHHRLLTATVSDRSAPTRPLSQAITLLRTAITSTTARHRPLPPPDTFHRSAPHSMAHRSIARGRVGRNVLRAVFTWAGSWQQRPRWTGSYLGRQRTPWCRRSPAPRASTARWTRR